MTDQTYFVEIVKYDDEEVIERRGPFTEWKANKIDDGLNKIDDGLSINLNHEAYFTRVVEGEKATAKRGPENACRAVNLDGTKECALPRGHSGSHQRGAARWANIVTVREP